MFKILLVSITTMTACATSEPVLSGEGSMPSNAESETEESPAFATSEDGTRIAFEKEGKGPALIIVGGALSQRNGGKPLAGALKEHFTVYTYDRRGRGESGDTKPYAVEREIEDLGALVEQAGNTAYIYGVSSGAALALQTAAELGAAKVPKLALYEPPYGQAERDFNEQKERVNQLVRTGKPGDAAEFFLSAIGMPPPALEEMKRSPEWEGIKKVDATLVYDYAVLGNGAAPDTAKQVTSLTLVLDGEKSIPFIHPAADRLAEALPNAQRKTLPGQTHQAAPEAVAPVLIEFFGDEG
jgi:pimeloyl-ACP methyl ester carboxylesterase